MKVNISRLPDELRGRTEELCSELGWELSASGYSIIAEKGEKLTVTAEGKGYKVVYPTLNQYFRGLSLIKRSHGKKSVCVEEESWVKELGIMLDCSRNAVRSVPHIKEIVRRLALMGYNVLQLYTEDTYEVENEPYFGYRRGRYSVAEMKEIDEYAAGYGIEVQPCIQTLAHLNQIFRWQEYSRINDVSDIMLIDDERTYKLIRNMFSTLSKAFRSRNIHIGMDEAHLVGRGKYEDRNGAVENRSLLILKHLKKVVEIAEEFGYKPMMWSDMFFRLAFDGKYYVDGSKSIPAEIRELVPQSLRLVYWDYYGMDKSRYDNMLKLHLEFNNEVAFAGGAWAWTGVTPINAASLQATDLALASCNEHGVNNILMTIWGDDGGECSDAAVLPVLCLTAERAYGHTDWKEAFYYLTDVKADDFLYIDCANAVDEYPQPRTVNPAKYMLYSDCIGGLMDCMVREGSSAVYEGYVRQLKLVEKSAGRFAYLFTTQRALCEVLLLKYELGVKTRNLYLARDLKALKTLVKECYNPLVKKVEALYEAVREQWNRENKPHGFEIQDFRFGGLMQRIKSCAKRIEEFASGKLSAIPELEETMLDPWNDKGAYIEKRLGRYNYFDRIIGVSRINHL